MAVLEGSSGRMIYWGRFCLRCRKRQQYSRTDGHLGQFRQTDPQPRENLRRQPDNNGHIVITGFAVCNTNAFGTVAPHHPKKGFDFTWPSSDDPFVTLPVNVPR